ncbi:uncharacterized protein LOC130967798 [Arachis stenosperma]|uniref:uncharacterized protein LOC130967798 n=1 Tax=Arachis stenosperma TaxID=217475 RepID=UPI0025AC6184|nr:uncharacterized protein LOC130967798 [Arachis stenosperma]
MYQRLEIPKDVDENCWHRDPASRPTFRELLEKLRELQIKDETPSDDGWTEELNLYIVTTAVYGGMCMGVLTVLGDLMMGPFGTGAEIMLCELAQALEKEHDL